MESGAVAAPNATKTRERDFRPEQRLIQIRLGPSKDSTAALRWTAGRNSLAPVLMVAMAATAPAIMRELTAPRDMHDFTSFSWMPLKIASPLAP